MQQADLCDSYFFAAYCDRDIEIFQQTNLDSVRLAYIDNFMRSETLSPINLTPFDLKACKSDLTAHAHISEFREIRPRGDYRQCFELLNNAVAHADSKLYLRISYGFRSFLYAQFGLQLESRISMGLSALYLRDDRLGTPEIRASNLYALSQSAFRLQQVPRTPAPSGPLLDLLKRHYPNLRVSSVAFQALFDRGVQLRQHVDGRCQRVVVNCAMDVGRVIAVDRSLCTVLDPNAVWRRCAHCLDECRMSLIPCHQCRTTMYCSQQCQQAAKVFHDIECNIARFLYEWPDMHLLVRLLLTAFEKPRDVNEMMQHCAAGDDGRAIDLWKPYNFFALHTNDAALSRMDLLKLLYALRFHPQYTKPPVVGQLHLCRQSVFAYRVLKHHTEFIKTVCPEQPQRLFMREFIYNLVLVLRVFGRRTHRLWSLLFFSGEKSLRRSATIGVYPLCSTLKHSCTPNVVAMPVGPDRVLLCAVRPIAANEELTLDRMYGVDEEKDYEAKKEDEDEFALVHSEKLLEAYRIACECYNEERSCRPDLLPFANQWTRPASALLPYRMGHNQLLTIPNFLTRYRLQSSAVLYAFYRELSSYMTRNDAHYPCQQLYQARAVFDFCLNQLYGPRELPVNPNHDAGIRWEQAQWEETMASEVLSARLVDNVREWLANVTPGTPAGVRSVRYADV